MQYYIKCICNARNVHSLCIVNRHLLLLFIIICIWGCLLWMLNVHCSLFLCSTIISICSNLFDFREFFFWMMRKNNVLPLALTTCAVHIFHAQSQGHCYLVLHSVSFSFRRIIIIKLMFMSVFFFKWFIRFVMIVCVLFLLLLSLCVRSSIVFYYFLFLVDFQFLFIIFFI